jgi:type I restriction enzyme S subunit
VTSPQLRFPSFRGEWQEKKLGDLASFTSGFPFDGSQFGLEGRKLVIPKNFTKFGYGNFSPEYSKFTTEECSPNYVCKPSDLLILMTDLSRECELLGKPLFLRGDDEEVLLNQRIAKVIASNGVYLSFLLNLLLTEKYHKKIKELATGSTVKHLSLSSIKSIELNFPSSDEQQKIASFLSKVDQKITLLSKKYELLVQYKRGVMQKIFNQEIRFKDNGEKDFPEWEIKRIGDVAKLKNGYAFKSSSYDASGSFTVVTIANVQSGKMVFDRESFLKELPNDLQKHQILDVGDTLISLTGNVGRACKVTRENCLLNQRVGKLIATDISPEYLYELINSDKFLSAMTELSQGGAQKNIGTSDVEGYEIPVPSKLEQSLIFALLSSLQKQIELSQMQVELAKQYKQGLLQQMFI